MPGLLLVLIRQIVKMCLRKMPISRYLSVRLRVPLPPLVENNMRIFVAFACTFALLSGCAELEKKVETVGEDIALFGEKIDERMERVGEYFDTVDKKATSLNDKLDQSFKDVGKELTELSGELESNSAEVNQKLETVTDSNEEMRMSIRELQSSFDKAIEKRRDNADILLVQSYSNAIDANDLLKKYVDVLATNSEQNALIVLEGISQLAFSVDVIYSKVLEIDARGRAAGDDLLSKLSKSQTELRMVGSQLKTMASQISRSEQIRKSQLSAFEKDSRSKLTAIEGILEKTIRESTGASVRIDVEANTTGSVTGIQTSNIKIVIEKGDQGDVDKIPSILSNILGGWDRFDPDNTEIVFQK